MTLPLLHPRPSDPPLQWLAPAMRNIIGQSVENDRNLPWLYPVRTVWMDLADGDDNDDGSRDFPIRSFERLFSDESLLCVCSSLCADYVHVKIRGRADYEKLIEARFSTGGSDFILPGALIDGHGNDYAGHLVLEPWDDVTPWEVNGKFTAWLTGAPLPRYFTLDEYGNPEGLDGRHLPCTISGTASLFGNLHGVWITGCTARASLSAVFDNSAIETDQFGNNAPAMIDADITFGAFINCDNTVFNRCTISAGSHVDLTAPAIIDRRYVEQSESSGDYDGWGWGIVSGGEWSPPRLGWEEYWLPGGGSSADNLSWDHAFHAWSYSSYLMAAAIRDARRSVILDSVISCEAEMIAQDGVSQSLSAVCNAPKSLARACQFTADNSARCIDKTRKHHMVYMDKDGNTVDEKITKLPANSKAAEAQTAALSTTPNSTIETSAGKITSKADAPDGAVASAFWMMAAQFSKLTADTAEFTAEASAENHSETECAGYTSPGCEVELCQFPPGRCNANFNNHCDNFECDL